MASNCMCVQLVPDLSPCSRDEITVHVLCTIELLVLESRVSYPQQTVQDNADFHDDIDSGRVMLHGSPQNLGVVRQDAESISNHPLGAGKHVVNIFSSLSRPRRLYGFIMVSRRAKASSPMKKQGTSWQSLGRGSGAGNPMVPSSANSLISELLCV